MSTTIFNLKTMRPIARGVGVVAPPGCVAVAGLHDMEMSRLVERSDDFGDMLYSVEPTLPPRPADSAERTWSWDDSARDWVPSLTLAGHRARRWSAIKAARAAEISGPHLVVGGKLWQVDPPSVVAIRGQLDVAAVVGESWSAVWTFADDSLGTVFAADLRAVLAAVGLRAHAAHQRAQALRQAIDAAASVAEVNTVEWTGQ